MCRAKTLRACRTLERLPLGSVGPGCSLWHWMGFQVDARRHTHALSLHTRVAPALSRHSLYTARTCTRALPAAFKVPRPAVGGVGENRGRENSLGTGGTGATPRVTERQTTVGPLTSGQLTSGKLKTDDILGKPREARASKGDGVPIKVGETICLYSADRQAYLSMNDLEGPRPPWMDAFG